MPQSIIGLLLLTKLRPIHYLSSVHVYDAILETNAVCTLQAFVFTGYEITIWPFLKVAMDMNNIGREFYIVHTNDITIISLDHCPRLSVWYKHLTHSALHYLIWCTAFLLCTLVD